MLFAVLGGCGSLWSSGGPAEARSEQIAAREGSLAGHYLAARHARSGHQEPAEATFLLAALRKAPDDPVLLGRAFRALLLGGKPETGIEIARRYVEKDPSATLAQLAIAVGDFRDGRYQRAIDRLQTITKPPYAAAIVPAMKAWALYAQGNKEAALAEIAPNDARKNEVMLQAHSGWMRDLMGDPAAALPFADAVVKAEPDAWLRLTQLLGTVYERAGRTEDARAVYQRFLDKRPDSRVLDSSKARLERGTPPARLIRSANDGMAEALFDAAGILARQNQRDSALMLANLALYLRPDFPELQILTADLLDGFERYTDAIKLYDSIDRRSLLAWSARLSKASNLNRLDRFEEARTLLRKLAVERPEDPEPLIQLGDMFRQREQYAEAVPVYDEAVARLGTPQKRHWRLFYVRGMALERTKDWPRAEADLLKALEFEPDQPMVLNYLGYSWVDQGMNLEKAEKMIRKALEQRPKDGYIVDSLGWVLYRLGRYEAAVTELERAVLLRPEDPVINDHLGDAYWAVGRQREARYQWRAALARNPEPELKVALEKKIEHGIERQASVGTP